MGISLAEQSSFTHNGTIREATQIVGKVGKFDFQLEFSSWTRIKGLGGIFKIWTIPEPNNGNNLRG